MKKLTLKTIGKILGVLLVAVLLVNFAPETLANNAALSEGGQGLAIPTGDAQLSSDIRQDRSLGELITLMVNFFTGFLGFIAVIVFIYAGVLMVVAGGNDEQITKAKKIMTYAAIGLLVVILSFSIVSFITSAGQGGGLDQDDTQLECGYLDENASLIECSEGLVCLAGKCVTSDGVSGTGGFQDQPEGVVTSGPSVPVFEENLDQIDDGLADLQDAFTNLASDVQDLPAEDREDVQEILNSPGDLNDKQARLEDLLDATNDPEVAELLDRIIRGIQRLEFIKREFEKFRDNMPESDAINQAYADTAEALNDLIDDPDSSVKLRRFESEYRALKDIVNKFPVVEARIRAFPGEDNVPFTVTLDGLNSIDPTGGTISDYKWSFLDNSGNEISLGSEPVVTREFTEPNTYSIRLRASTSQTDAGGFKTAADGLSVIRIKANPPSSQVEFLINGKEVTDVYHITLEEAEAGLTFDPTRTSAALGRTVEEYNWSFGDTTSEKRTTPGAVVHSYTSAGEYFVQLEATDNIGNKDRKIVKLFVKSVAADIDVTPKEGNVNTEFTFRGLESRSDLGAINEYEWDIQDAEGRTIADSEEEVFTYSFERPGTYRIQLIVTDFSGQRDTILETVKIESRDPVANFTAEARESNHPNRIEFNAIDSYDPDEGDSITYSWDFDGDGDFDVVDSEDIQIEHIYNRVGEFRARLQVQDQFGKIDLVEKEVNVDSILSADIELPKRAGIVGEEMEFKVVNSNAEAYLWEFGDGQTTSTEEDEVTYTYTQKGKYKVKLNFFDDDDNDNTDTTTIIIGDGEEPIAALDLLIDDRNPRIVEDLCGEDKDGVRVTRADLIRFSASNSVNTDGSGRLLSYDWKFSNGDSDSKREFNHRFTELSTGNSCIEVSLAVRDQIQGGVSEEDVMYFRVENEVPSITDLVIDAGTAELVTPAKVKLKVVTPKDVDGNIKKYKWYYFVEGDEDEQLGTHFTTMPETEMVITAEGEADVKNNIFFNVEVIDNDGGTYDATERFGDVSSLEVTNGPNLSPVVDFSVDKTTISVGDSITFVSSSYDPQGDELSNTDYRWDFDGDGEFDDSSSGPQVNRQFNTPGEYEVRLKVTHRGLSTSAVKKIFVQPTQSLPQAAFTYKIEGNTVIFDGIHSRFDPDLEDTTLRFEWDFDVDDDANGNGINDDDIQSQDLKPSFTYLEKKAYRVRLIVKDTLGMQGVVVRDVDLNLNEQQLLENSYSTLNVTSNTQALTTLSLNVIPAEMLVGQTADVTAIVLNADGTPYNGEVFFEILEGAGELTPNPVEATDSRATAIFTATDPGEVKLQVRATNTIFGELVEQANINVR